VKGAVFPLVPLPLLLLPLISPTPSPTRGEGGVWASRCLKREKVQAEALPERVEAPAGLERLCQDARRRRAYLRWRFSHSWSRVHDSGPRRRASPRRLVVFE